MRVLAWTDSTIVRQWLSQLPITWTTCVANRVSYIQEILSRSNWNHVPTADNPADLASRGATVDDLLQCSLWWQGPVWLQRDSSHWPKLDIQEKDVPEREQYKTVTSEYNTKIVLAAQKTSTILDITRFDSLDRLIRVTSYVMKFILNLLNLYATMKHDSIASERSRNSTYRKNPPTFEMETHGWPNSQNYTISPFVDSGFNVIRVGGRLGKSNYHEEKISRFGPQRITPGSSYHQKIP